MTLTPEEWLNRLDRQLRADARPSPGRYGLLKLDAYLEGRQPLRFMAKLLAEELGDRITALVINWPRVVVDAYETRLDIEGFRRDRDSRGDDELWRRWQACDMDEQSQEVHVEALALGRAYYIVGAGDDAKTPLFTAEHPLQVTTIEDPRTRKPRAGIKRWEDEEKKQRRTLYLPNETRHYRRGRNSWEHIEDEHDEHGMDLVPVVPVVNRPRMLKREGVSVFTDVIPLADAVNKMATDMMVSGEFHIMPRRWGIGLDEDDFVDEQGNKISAWSSAAGHIWSTEKRPSEVLLGQFAESSLENFFGAIKLLAQLTGQIAALPPHYMGFAADNPASADAIRSSEAQLVKRSERMQKWFGGPAEEAQRIGDQIITSKIDDKLRMMETLWRDASTPTDAQKADAVTKKFQVGIIDLEQAREDLGYTSTQRSNMAERDKAALQRAGGGALLDALTGPKPEVQPEPAPAA